MERLLKIAELKQLEKQVALGEISYSKMVEIINFKHLKELSELRFKLNTKAKSSLFTEKQLEEAIEMAKKIKEFVWEDGEKLAVRYNTYEIIQSLKQPKQ